MSTARLGNFVRQSPLIVISTAFLGLGTSTATHAGQVTDTGVPYRVLFREGAPASVHATPPVFGFVSAVVVNESGACALFASEGAMFGSSEPKGLWTLLNGHLSGPAPFASTQGASGGERPLVEWSLGEDQALATISIAPPPKNARPVFDANKAELSLFKDGPESGTVVGKIGESAGDGYQISKYRQVIGPFENGNAFALGHLWKSGETQSGYCLCSVNSAGLRVIKLADGSIKIPEGAEYQFGASPSGQLVVRFSGIFPKGASSDNLWFLEGDKLVPLQLSHGSATIRQFVPLRAPFDYGGMQIDAHSRVLGLVDGKLALVGPSSVEFISLARTGDADQSTGLVLDQVLNAHLVPGGGVVVMGRFLGAENKRYDAMTIWNGTTVQTVASVGDKAPGMGDRFEIAGFLGDTGANSAGSVVFAAKTRAAVIEEEANTPPDGIWAGKPGTMKLLVKQGDTLQIAPGSKITVAEAALVGPRPISDGGHVVVMIRTGEGQRCWVQFDAGK